MLIDRTHRGWMFASLAMVAAGAAVYTLDPQASSQGRHSGATWVGLGLGAVALSFMIFCALLGLKRRVPHWRIGRAQTWLRGHIWLGLVSVWFVALHSAFATGGTMTSVIWLLLALVTASSLFGIGLQQTIPRLLMHSINGETVSQLITTELDDLRDRCQSVCAAIESDELRQPLDRFAEQYVAPFLSGQRGAALGRYSRSESLFEGLRTMCPEETHEAVDMLRQICDRYRHVKRQRVLMRVLHSWLIVHVPLSWGLLFLSIVHAVWALRWSAVEFGGAL